jgi:S-adenosylmethionine synthetase
LSHRLLRELAAIRKAGVEMTYLRPDSKSQVTIEYGDDGAPARIEAIVISTQHDDFIRPIDANDTKEKLRVESEMLARIKEDVRTILIPRVLADIDPKIAAMYGEDCALHVNPTGVFVIGGPHGDTGLTGRKIIVDTYGGRGAHGGGAFSGKDPSKVDRSAAYATRHVAKNLVAAGVCDEVLVQVAYAIGMADPVGLYVDTNGTSKVNLTDGEIAKRIGHIFSLRPYDIEQRFNLRSPIYQETAAYGHMGRKTEKVTKTFVDGAGVSVECEVVLFPWEALDCVEQLQSEFGL